MACYDLQFVQRKTPEGLTQYVLEPDLYSLTTFSSIEGMKQLPYSIKQMLAREVHCSCYMLGFLFRLNGQGLFMEPGTSMTSVVVASGGVRDTIYTGTVWRCQTPI